MNLLSALHISTWHDRFAEFRLQFRELPETTVPTTWPLDESLLKSCQIRWPRRYSWALGSKWLAPIKAGLEARVAVVVDDIDQPEGALCQFELQIGRDVYPVAIDYSDYPRIKSEVAAQQLLYFKLQFHSAGYSSVGDKVLPGGYLPNGELVYRMLSELRGMKDSVSPIYQVYGRFGMEFAQDIRKQAVTLLHNQQSFSYEGTTACIRYSRFLREVAHALVCVDLPGNGALCFRLFDYLAIGSCIVGPKPDVVLPVPLIEGVQITFCRDDLSDLVDLCDHYVRNPERALKISQAARDYFDRFVHREQLAAYYLYSCFTRIKGEIGLSAQAQG